MNNKIIKLLSSIPVILLALYFIPFLGVILLILRLFVTNNKKSSSIIIIVTGFIILIPKLVSSILDLIKFDTTKIPYFNTIIESELYSIDFIKYSKLLITIGVIFLIINFLCNSLFSKLKSSLISYAKKEEEQRKEIIKENDMVFKERKEIARNTYNVKCPYCGADNLISEKVGTCKYCRRKIENKNYKL